MTRQPRLTLVKSAPEHPHAPTARGYVVAYRGAATRCPGCSHSNWHVGRLSVECAFCGTVLPFGEARHG
jgi:uncharacterized protein (DUF983 family)